MPYKIIQSKNKVNLKKREELMKTIFLTLSGTALAVEILNSLETILLTQ